MTYPGFLDPGMDPALPCPWPDESPFGARPTRSDLFCPAEIHRKIEPQSCKPMSPRRPEHPSEDRARGRTIFLGPEESLLQFFGRHMGRPEKDMGTVVKPPVGRLG